MTYTKGPWRACQADGNGCSCHMIWSTESDCVVAVAIEAKDKSYTGGEGIVDESMVRANAQLIAAAPLLYEALKVVEQDGTVMKTTRIAVAKALAKVEVKK